MNNYVKPLDSEYHLGDPRILLDPDILPEDTLIFDHFRYTNLIYGIRDGVSELITGDDVITTNSTVGRLIEFYNGSITWDTINIDNYVFVFQESGQDPKHYAFMNGIKYLNGEVTVVDFPITITSTGISNITGTLWKIYIYSESKSIGWVDIDFNMEERFWNLEV